MNRWSTPLSLLAVLGCGNENAVEYQTNTDTWPQAENNQVDILWVVDNSFSMAEEQATLAAGFASFAQQLESSGTDFQLGVITTSVEYADPATGVLVGVPPFLTAAEDYLTEFPLRATSVGVGGSDKEKGLEAALFALHPTMILPGGANEGFLRAAAQLLIVIVSDEEDCSDNGALEGQPPTACYTEQEMLTPVPTVVEELRNIKDGQDDLVQLGAIVGLDGSTCPDVFPGDRYASVAALTGGLVGDICDSDWSNVLGELGLNATGIRTTFQLSAAAQVDTLEVFVDETQVSESAQNGWTYDAATWYLTFHNEAIPPRGALISATYTVDPGVSEPSTEPTTAP